MPFLEVSKMDGRKHMITLVNSGCSVAEAARRCGISRPTAYLWLRRAAEQGLDQLQEGSRRPQHLARTTAPAVVAQLLAAKAEHPGWGAKKLLDVAWPPDQGIVAPIAIRTADRILARHYLTTPRPQPGTKAPCQHFVHPRCNGLWQCDFKSLGKPTLGYWPLTVLDDRSRFVLAFEPLPQQESEAVFAVLWQLFGAYGMPERILSDNGSCFAGTWTQHGPSRLEAKLWRLGINTTHGRPYHPQTQGKVERFHRTIGEEARSRGVSLRQADPASAKPVYEWLLAIYNWVRPHEALEMQVPGAVYSPAATAGDAVRQAACQLRPRPARLPTHEELLEERRVPAAETRKVWPNGCVGWQRQTVPVGKALAGERVEVVEDEADVLFRYAGVVVARWSECRGQRTPAAGDLPAATTAGRELQVGVTAPVPLSPLLRGEQEEGDVTTATASAAGG